MNQNNLFKEYEGIFEAETAEENSDSKEKKERMFGYNPFALQDAVGERNVKKIWIEYEKLRLDGIEAEELIHKIVSKVRDMLAICLGASRENLGIQKDYPYNKSKRDAKNWKEEDLKFFYTKLVEIYHHARMGSSNELNVTLEKTLLSI
jgi:DNA polymerase III gamma/tau subunit